MSLKQLLLITTIALLITLQTGLGLRGQVRSSQNEARQARQDAIEARKLTLESKKYETQLMNITMYAPLDPGAVRGQDFAGDPSVTYSGEKVVPGKTAAAGPNIPFGTEIYVEDVGWFTVQDRGRLIGPNDVDLAVASKEEAIEFGKQRRLVILKAPED